MRVVVDTNVVVSAAFWSGPPRQVVRAWLDGAFELVISVDILEEYLRVLEELGMAGERLVRWRDLFLGRSLVVEPAEEVRVVADDPDDDKFLSAAVAAEAAFIVSGDKHLLRVGSYRGVKIVKPRPFVEQLHSRP